MDPLLPLVLWIHLFSAVLFVGGSFFMWLVVVPASHLITEDESQRTQIVGKIAKAFGKITVPILAILVLTGIYNITWYIPFSDLFTTAHGMVLVAKTTTVLILLVLIFVHNVYYGKKIVQLARERRLDELKELRKRSRVISFTNLALMILILVFAVLLQVPL